MFFVCTATVEKSEQFLRDFVKRFLNKSKCQFDLEKATVLQHVTSSDEIKPYPKKTKTFLQVLTAENLDLQHSFLVAYDNFMKYPNYLDMLEPLCPLTR